MAPLADFFDRPVLRRFLASVFAMLAIWLLLELIFSRSFAEWSSSSWFEVTYLIPLVWFVVAKTHRATFSALFRGFSLGSLRWFHLLIVLVLGIIASFGIDNLMSLLVATFAPDYITSAINMEVIEPGSHWMLNGWTALAAVVVAPFMEELVFRGLLYERLATKWNVRRSALISSLVFGLLHAEAWLGAAIFGLLMCIVYHQTKNLWMPIIVHVANNLIALLLMFFDGQEQTTLMEYQQKWPYFLAALLVLPGVYLFVKKFFPSEQSPLPYRRNLHLVS